MKNSKIIVKTKSKSYPIYFGDEILSHVPTLVKKNIPGAKKILIISDKNLPPSLLRKFIKSLKKYKPNL